MQRHWVLSKFFMDANGTMTPVANAYCIGWRCPKKPASVSDYAFIELLCGPQHVEAAKADPRIKVGPYMEDDTPLAADFVSVYADMGVTSAMSLKNALNKLGEAEPNFLAAFRSW